MIKTFLLLVYTCCLLRATGQNTDTTYFEGVIEYDISSESFMQGISSNEIGLRTGSKLVFYYKKGNFIREYRDDAGYTGMKFIYKARENNLYSHYINFNPDTLFYNSGADTSNVTWSVSDSLTEKVLNYSCKGVTIAYHYISPVKKSEFQYRHTFFFCPALPVNPDWQKDMAGWNEVLAANPYIAIKFSELAVGLYRQTFTATKIEWKKLDDSLFDYDPKLILKKAVKE
jgi:hypothetical protein